MGQPLPNSHAARCILCRMPQKKGSLGRQWICEDCGTPYDADDIEERLLNIVDRKLLRYQMQDIREKKTNRVVTRCLLKLAESSNGLELDISQQDAVSNLELLRSLATLHGLESLQSKTEGILKAFR